MRSGEEEDADAEEEVRNASDGTGTISGAIKYGGGAGGEEDETEGPKVGERGMEIYRAG